MNSFFKHLTTWILNIFGGNAKKPQLQIAVAPVRVYRPASDRHMHSMARRIRKDGSLEQGDLRVTDPAAWLAHCGGANGDVRPRRPGEYIVVVRPDHNVH